MHILKGIVITAVGFFLLIGLFLAAPWPLGSQVIHGVTFSQLQAEGLGLDWREAYGAILNDLGVRHLRLSAYWNLIEPEEDEFDWSGLDYQMDLAAEAGAKVILSVGRKLPRWPECHEPEWVKDMAESEKQMEILTMLAVVVERYKDHPALVMWQLENEPLLDYGECADEDRELLLKEEVLLRSMDGVHPILITDSGELNWWLDASEYGDVLGTTMYRTVFSDKMQKSFSYDYIFPAWMYRAKARYIKVLRGKDVIVSELQGEPWGSMPFKDMSKEDREEVFSKNRLMEMKRFVDRTQLPEVYWWGAEYWYWEKEQYYDASYWETAKTFFADVK